MDPHGALNILNQASSHFKGTREEHMMIQQAISVLQNLINSTQNKDAAEPEAEINAEAPAADTKPLKTGKRK